VEAEASDIKRDFVLFDGATTIGQIRDKIRSLRNLWVYVVAQVGEKFSVFRLDDLIADLRASNPSFDPRILSLPLESRSDLLAQQAADSLEEANLSPGRVRALFRDAPSGRWVVLHDGKVTGVLAKERRGPGKMDLDWMEPTASSRATRPPTTRSKPPTTRAMPLPPPPAMPPPSAARPTEAVRTPRGTRSRGTAIPASPRAAEPPPSLTLGVEETAAEAAPAPQPRSTGASAPAEPVDEKRFINAELEGHDAKEPLKVGERYTIAFDVDVEARATAVGAVSFRGTFAPSETEIELTVQLSSDDFDVPPEAQKLRVPRRGKSRNKARFEVTPKKNGPGTIQAVFLKNGNFIQLMTVHLSVGVAAAAVTSESLGRPLDAGFGVQPRDVTLILESDSQGFKATLASPVFAWASLPIQRSELDQMISQAREVLLAIVQSDAPGGKVYQTGLTIPEDVNREALKKVAQAGFRLFQRMFFGPAADEQSKRVGKTIREMARGKKLKFQIVSKDFLLPWGILYMADAFDPDHIDPDLFLGLKHVVEHLPLQQGLHVTTTEIDGRPRFQVSLNLNSEIDTVMGIGVIARQRTYWEKVGEGGKTEVTVRDKDDEVKTALANPSLPDQLLYFYCHASSKSLSQGGPDASALVFSDGKLTLGDLAVFAPTETLLKGSPLIFINACESAELSPLFYDGFVPYFMAKGARGVIGTECLTPALFAAEWAERFFDEFLKGKPVGEIFLNLRQTFYKEHNNLLGLLYALYCDGDTQLIAA
jgi:CHAT domain